MKNDGKGGKIELILVLLLFFAISFLAQDVVSFSQGPNNRNVTIDTRLNVTGSAPEVFNVSFGPNIVLTAGSDTLVTCNATIRDFNGFADLENVTARMFDEAASTYDSAQENNTHYRNDTCVATGTDGAHANYTCGFRVRYYANATLWNCTIVVNDTIGLRGNSSNESNISSLLALNVTPLIDYGNMAMGDTSTNQTANVTNLGNVPINISVESYGGAIADGLSFRCAINNLTADLQRVAANLTAPYSEKVPITSGSRTDIPQLTIAKTLDNAGSLNITYWQVFLDTGQNVFGECNGSIIFQAESWV